MPTDYTINNYLNNLKNQLIKNDVLEYQIILNDIEMRMKSLLQVWNDKEMRRGILLFAKEEAQFYQPEASIDIKSFVITTIRNSLIESVSSSGYKSAGFKNQLDEKQIKPITSYAIRFFKKFNFEEACNNLKMPNNDNYYLVLINKYPLAWNIICKTANLKSFEFYFDPIHVEEKNFISLPSPNNCQLSKDNYFVLEDGMTPAYNELLYQLLKDVAHSKKTGFFYRFI